MSHLSLEGFLYGMGLYCADRPSMDRFQAAVDRDAAAFRTAIAVLGHDNQRGKVALCKAFALLTQDQSLAQGPSPLP